jgi:hypothetical protein
MNRIEVMMSASTSLLQQKVIWMSLVLTTGVTFAAQSSATPLPPPHILFILVDDLGWGNVGYHIHPSAVQRQKEVQTPVIDWLAKKEGLELNRHYVRAHLQVSKTESFFGTKKGLKT